MKVKLKKGVKPFRYPKFGKVWRIKDGAKITEKVFDRLKHKVEKEKPKVESRKVEKPKEKKITAKVKGVNNG